MSQVFELYFNPRHRPGLAKQTKLEKDIIFDSFCYEPENIYERRLGGLYILGELKNVLPQNLRLLDKISQVIKEKYYSNYLKSPEEALKESLKSLNDFFAEEIKKDNTSWMGNLGLAIISATLHQKPWVDLNFTKIGDLKILLLREGQVSDIGSKLKLQEIEPYPLKVFSNIVSGKIAEGDIIAIFTKDVFDFFQTKNLIQKIAKEQVKDKKIKELLKPEEKELVKISGICLLVQIQPEMKPKAVLAFQKKFETLPVSQIFLRFLNLIKNSHRSLTRGFAKLKIPKIPKIPKISLFKITLPQFKFKMPVLNKNLILISLLIFVLISGFFFFQREKEKEIIMTKNSLQEIETKITQAENFLLLKDEEKANTLYQEALQDVLPLIKKDSPLSGEAMSLKKSIKEELNNLNKLEKIESPKILFEFDPQETKLIPYKMLLSSSTLYFYNPLSSNVYKFEIVQGTSQLLEGKRDLQFGVQYLDSVLFFTKPNFIISLKNNDEFEEKIFELPDFNNLASSKTNIYFLNSKSGEIIRYKPSLNKKEFWLEPETKKVNSSKSFNVAGSIWVLTEAHKIDRYYGGLFQETLKINLFPQLKSPTKIWTNASLPYLYLLEPYQKRIVILSKEGKIVKQYQNEKFDNLLDFAVTPDGKEIYLLNGLKVYQINE